nr:unnamed protein product [Callosobruchus chinensis]
MPSFGNFGCDGDPSTVGLRWQEWKRALQIYLDAAGIENSDKGKAVLFYFGGIGLQEIFYNLPRADVTEKLDQYSTPKQSKVKKMHKLSDSRIWQLQCYKFTKGIFLDCLKKNGEKFETFLVRLRHQAAKCQFSTS